MTLRRVEKLKKIASQPISSLEQALYFIAEIRKLLEATGDYKRYYALGFHCDWALHSILDGAGAVRLLEKFDHFDAWVNSGSPTDPNEFIFMLDFMTSIGLMAKFRSQLEEFLSKNQIDRSISTGIGWRNFLSYYIEVISDSPLQCRASGLQNVDSVTVYLAHSERSPIGVYEEMGFSLMFEWVWYSKTGKEWRRFGWPISGVKEGTLGKN